MIKQIEILNILFCLVGCNSMKLFLYTLGGNQLSCITDHTGVATQLFQLPSINSK